MAAIFDFPTGDRLVSGPAIISLYPHMERFRNNAPKLVLYYLMIAHRVEDGQISSFRVADAVKKIGISKPSVYRGLRELDAAGVISWSARSNTVFIRVPITEYVAEQSEPKGTKWIRVVVDNSVEKL